MYWWALACLYIYSATCIETLWLRDDVLVQCEARVQHKWKFQYEIGVKYCCFAQNHLS